MSTGLLPLARHYSSRLSLKVTIAGGVYCLIVNKAKNKKVDRHILVKRSTQSQQVKKAKRLVNI
jgi:hypothetical protein